MATFGRTEGEVDSGVNFEDIIVGDSFTITEKGTADSISVYAIVNVADTMKCMIYDGDNNHVGTTEELNETSPGGEYGWITFNFTETINLVKDTTYKLCIFIDSNAGNSKLGYTSTSGGAGFADNNAYPTVPDPLEPVLNNDQFLIYCTYTPDTTPDPPAPYVQPGYKRGQKEVMTKYPVTSGLTAGTTKQTGRITNLVPKTNHVPVRKRVGYG